MVWRMQKNGYKFSFSCSAQGFCGQSSYSKYICMAVGLKSCQNLLERENQQDQTWWYKSPASNNMLVVREKIHSSYLFIEIVNKSL